MEQEQLTSIVQEQLSRTLGFFPRADARGSVILGIDIGMLALLAGNTPAWDLFGWYLLPALIPVALIGISLWHLFQSFFPRLDGGERSLIYFREIARRPESIFIDDFLAQNSSDRIKDFLRQTWCNSQILTKKYDHLKNAFVFLAWAIFPWILVLILFVLRNSNTHSLLK